jgi:putative transcriptional regulator
MVQNSSDISIRQGQLLIASPFLYDGNFRKSVVLLAEHNEKGSLGFIINQKTTLTLSQVLEGIPQDWPIYYGGPVGNDSLFYVHTLGSAVEGARHIKGNLWWGGTFESLKALLLEERRVAPTALRFFAGYSGWAEGQLLSEMEEDAWIIRPLDHLNVLEDNPDEMWRSLILKYPDYALWSNMPEAPYLN